MFGINHYADLEFMLLDYSELQQKFNPVLTFIHKALDVFYLIIIILHIICLHYKHFLKWIYYIRVHFPDQ